MGFNNDTVIEQDLMYNCGDSYFQYEGDNFFIGPNFGIFFDKSDNSCDNGTCYFDYDSPSFNYTFFSNLSHKDCLNGFIFPSLYDPREISSPLIYICIEIEVKRISSYNLYRDYYKDHNELELTNSIVYDPLTIIDFNYDLDDRGIFILFKGSDWLSE